MITLDQQIKIYIPSKIGNKTVCNINEVNHVQELLTNLFGGTTTYYTIGTYKGLNAEIIKEKINIVQSFTDQISDNDLSIIQQEITLLKHRMKQESIAFEINNKLYLI